MESLIVVVVIVALILFVIARTAVVVPQQSAYVVENLGKYSRTIQAGFHILIPFVERVAYRPVLVWTLVAAGLIALAVQQRSRYLLPLYPAMALLIAAAVTGVTARARELLRLATGLVLALIALTLYQGLMQGVKLALGRHHGRAALTTPFWVAPRRQDFCHSPMS